MPNTDETPQSGYASAHMAHYKDDDLRKALVEYRNILVAHPDSPEAGYARTQIHNIARSLIPPDDIVEALIALVLERLDQRDGAETER